MESLFDKLGGRKFALTLLVILVGALVEAFGKNGLSQNFVALLLGSSTIFGAANAMVTMKAGELTAGQGASEPVADEGSTITAGIAADAHSNAAEAHNKIDMLASELEQQRAELAAQAQNIDLATKLLKTLVKF
jgi:TolA-binding protein